MLGSTTTLYLIMNKAFFLCMLLPLLSCGCVDIREAMIEERERKILREYEGLNECERVEYLRGVLLRGKQYDPFLESQWPQNATVLTMLMDLGERTGISYDIMISCWGGFAYGADEEWLKLIEPWQAALGCKGERADRAELLRWCDPLLAEAYDSLAGSRQLHKLVGATSPMRCALGHSLTLDPYSVGNALLRSVEGADTLPPEQSGLWMMTGDRTCWGLLPDSTDPDYIVFVGKANPSTIVVKIVRAPGNDCIYGMARCSDGIAFLLERRPDGTRRFIAGHDPALVSVLPR